MSSNVAESGAMRVMTEVLSPNDPRVAQLKNPSSPEQTRDSIVTQIFKKGQPKSLGTVQIIVGLLQIAFGIILTVAEMSDQSLTTCSGMYFWVGIPFFISGCVTVAAETNDNLRLVKCSVGTNLLGLIVAFVALILHIVEISMEYELLDGKQQDPYTKTLKISSNVVFLLFALLELATALTILVFGWKALRNIQQYTPMN